MIRRHPFVLAAVLWSAAWLTLDLTWGGLIESGFNTSGLQQAEMMILYPFGVAVIILAWLAQTAWRTVRRTPRNFAKPS